MHSYHFDTSDDKSNGEFRAFAMVRKISSLKLTVQRFTDHIWLNFERCICSNTFMQINSDLYTFITCDKSLWHFFCVT